MPRGACLIHPHSWLTFRDVYWLAGVWAQGRKGLWGAVFKSNVEGQLSRDSSTETLCDRHFWRKQVPCASLLLNMLLNMSRSPSRLLQHNFKVRQQQRTLASKLPSRTEELREKYRIIGQYRCWGRGTFRNHSFLDWTYWSLCSVHLDSVLFLLLHVPWIIITLQYERRGIKLW